MSRAHSPACYQDAPRRTGACVEQAMDLLMQVQANRMRMIELCLAAAIVYGLGFAIAMGI